MSLGQADEVFSVVFNLISDFLHLFYYKEKRIESSLQVMHVRVNNLRI